MEKTSTFKDLIVWRKSVDLTKLVYGLCEKLPPNENYGIASQIKRSAVSIPSNIAEGYKRKNRKEYVNFLSIASGSSGELETQLILLNELFDIDTRVAQLVAVEIQKMLAVMHTKLAE